MEMYEIFDPVTGDVIEVEGMVVLDKDDFYLELETENDMPHNYTQEQAIAAAESFYL